MDDKRFIFHSQIWAIDLLTWAAKQQEIIHATKVLLEKALKEERVVAEAVNLLKVVTLKEESKDLLAQYFFRSKVLIGQLLYNNISRLQMSVKNIAIEDNRRDSRIKEFRKPDIDPIQKLGKNAQRSRSQKKQEMFRKNKDVPKPKMPIKKKKNIPRNLQKILHGLLKCLRR